MLKGPKNPKKTFGFYVIFQDKTLKLKFGLLRHIGPSINPLIFQLEKVGFHQYHPASLLAHKKDNNVHVPCMEWNFKILT